MGQQRNTILGPLAAADEDFAIIKINVFDPKRETFHDAHAGAVEQLGHEAIGALELREKALNLLDGEHDRDVLRSFGPGKGANIAQRHLEDFIINENQGIQGLVLGAGGHGRLGQVNEELVNVLGVQFAWRALVEAVIATDPMGITLKCGAA